MNKVERELAKKQAKNLYNKRCPGCQRLFTDTAIANIIGVTPGTIRKWRKEQDVC